MLENYRKILEKSQKRITKLAQDALTAYEMTLEACTNGDDAKAAEARTLLKNTHDRNNKIDNEIIKTLALFSPEARDLRVVVAYFKIAGELTRITDYIRNYAKNVRVLIASDLPMELIRDNSLAFQRSALASLRAAVESIAMEEPTEELEELYRRVNVEESKCDDIFSLVEKDTIQQIYATPDHASELVRYLATMRKIERVSDRSVTIVKLIYFANQGGKLKL